jgi:hypothetical protein
MAGLVDLPDFRHARLAEREDDCGIDRDTGNQESGGRYEGDAFVERNAEDDRPEQREKENEREHHHLQGRQLG